MLWRGQPQWYRPNAGTAEERRIAAQTAEKKFTDINNWASLQRAIEDSAAHGVRTGATAPSTSSAGELTVSFSEQELNAFLEKWSVMYNWRDRYSDIVTDPVVVLQKDRLILAGKIKDMGTITSLHLAPSLDENGKLHLDLAGLQAGRLPLPDSFWAPRRDKLLALLRRHLPEWQRRAKIEENGSTNGEAMSAAFSEMLLDAASNTPTEPVLFLPLLLDSKRSVPVRLTSLTIEDGTMTLTAKPLSGEERRALLERIRNGPREASVATK